MDLETARAGIGRKRPAVSFPRTREEYDALRAELEARGFTVLTRWRKGLTRIRLGDIALNDEPDSVKVPADGSMDRAPAILRVGGKRFYCAAKDCDAGVFTRTGPGTYACNGCGAEYEAGEVPADG